MDWTPGSSGEDVEDRRGESSSGGGGFGFGGYGPHFGIGGTLVLLILSVVFHQNFFALFSGAPSSAPQQQSYDPQQQVGSGVDPSRSEAEKNEVEFVKFVLNDVQHTWDKLLPASGVRYRHAKLVLFRNATESACGTAQTATGPFYCPGDERVYIDLGFFHELSSRFGAPGEFAQAYVIAHEIGHHVQKLLGIEGKVRQAEESRPASANRLSVGLELQADCLAGVWGNSTEQRNIVHPNDVAAGLQAAASVGDDRLQKMATGHVSAETFTHGSSAQRTEWFRKGLDSGQVDACDTFGGR